MVPSFKVKAEGTDMVLSALEDLQPTVAEATKPVMQEAAQMVGAEAEMRASSRHVHNLWRSGSGRGLYPRYDVRHPGEFLWRVQTPGGALGKAEVMAEFMAEGHTPQGGALARNLSAAYGDPGRILWHAYDQLSPQLQADFEQAVQEAASKISQQTS